MTERTRRSITVDAPPEEVMAVIADFPSYPSWVAAARSVEVVGEGPSGLVAEPRAADGLLAKACARHGKALADRDGEGVHRKPDGKQQQLQKPHDRSPQYNTKTRLKSSMLSGLNCARMRYLPCWATAQLRHLPFLAQFILRNLLKISNRF